MDQEKIGKFIATCIKEQSLTQVQFAEKLGVTNKAVSKWETGKCLPDVSLFNDICILLDITLNELFSGERISPENIEKKSEENLINMATNYQKRDYRTLAIIYSTIIILIINIVLNISVSSLEMNGSSVFSNLFITVAFIISFGFFSRLTSDNILLQKISFYSSIVILTSSIVSFILSFLNINNNLTALFAFPCKVLFYGLELIFGWSLIYIIISILSLINLLYCNKNIQKSSTSN